VLQYSHTFMTVKHLDAGNESRLRVRTRAKVQKWRTVYSNKKLVSGNVRPLLPKGNSSSNLPEMASIWSPSQVLKPKNLLRLKRYFHGIRKNINLNRVKQLTYYTRNMHGADKHTRSLPTLLYTYYTLCIA
jgi:hypothetical protein